MEIKDYLAKPVSDRADVEIKGKRNVAEFAIKIYDGNAGKSYRIW